MALIIGVYCYGCCVQTDEPIVGPGPSGRANQKLRTRNAIVQAAVELMRTGRDVTMLEVAKAALVSEATAYRYFPDLASLLQEAMAGQMPTPAEALDAVGDSPDPVRRGAPPPQHPMRTLLGLPGATPALIAAAPPPPPRAPPRPGPRLRLIDYSPPPPQ